MGVLFFLARCILQHNRTVHRSFIMFHYHQLTMISNEGGIWGLYIALLVPKENFHFVCFCRIQTTIIRMKFLYRITQILVQFFPFSFIKPFSSLNPIYACKYDAIAIFYVEVYQLFARFYFCFYAFFLFLNLQLYKSIIFIVRSLVYAF